MSTYLVPLTAIAKEAVRDDRVAIDTFPFRVGRESRIIMVDGELRLMERRKKNSQPNNDLYIQDAGKRLNISREHLQIDKTGDAQYIVIDRGSACGTVVDGAAIGGRDIKGSAPIKNGGIITIGMPESPFRFRFECVE